MGLHGVSEAAVTQPGVAEEIQNLRALSLVSRVLGSEGCKHTTGFTSATGDDGPGQDRVKCWSAWLPHLSSHLEDSLAEWSTLIGRDCRDAVL